MQAIYDTDCSRDERTILGKSFGRWKRRKTVSLSFFPVSRLFSSLKRGFESTFYSAINSPRRVAFLAPSGQGKGFVNGKVSEVSNLATGQRRGECKERKEIRERIDSRGCWGKRPTRRWQIISIELRDTRRLRDGIIDDR